MSGPANRLCLRRLFQHFMFTLNAAMLNGGSVLPFWWCTKRSGDPTAAVGAGLDQACRRELSLATFFASCEDARLGGEPKVDRAIGLGCVFFFKWLRGAEGRPFRAGSKNPDI